MTFCILFFFVSNSYKEKKWLKSCLIDIFQRCVIRFSFSLEIIKLPFSDLPCTSISKFFYQKWTFTFDFVEHVLFLFPKFWCIFKIGGKSQYHINFVSISANQQKWCMKDILKFCACPTPLQNILQLIILNSLTTWAQTNN